MSENTNKESVLLIAMDKGIDSETGQLGYGYSPDNGRTFFVTNTIKGRKFRQEDADRLWKFLKPMIEKLMTKKFKNEFMNEIKAEISNDSSEKKSEEG
ncbi:hypothetical protein FD27_GL001069 [Limosilactobacillus frumenti DSM 13145]|uniref:Uncharacterized protein n=1 Tax=Limosilactobacillus frumenti DSM 13145 TaxID=1423746 RepID=A0A0R1PED4_9LACO|nr:hypothetical protein [Limosilactobacillus frumenti]KRL27315.1 hypothetical protein FD27_GL001069 [Limosilactobacillus frumenti DSM 13145]QFG72761.1 hypothetical protein LF145_05170 [Limosilactobacillus frumenti]